MRALRRVCSCLPSRYFIARKPYVPAQSLGPLASSSRLPELLALGTRLSTSRAPGKKKQLADLDVVKAFRSVLLLGPDKENLGETPTERALAIAQSKKLNLVLVSKSSGVDGLPVAYISHLGKFMYEQKKKEKSKSKGTKKLKEIRCQARITSHDLNIKLNQARKFLYKGHQVKVSVAFAKPRADSSYRVQEAARKVILQRIVGMVGLSGRADPNSVKRNPQAVTMLFTPIKRKLAGVTTISRLSIPWQTHFAAMSKLHSAPEEVELHPEDEEALRLFLAGTGGSKGGADAGEDGDGGVVDVSPEEAARALDGELAAEEAEAYAEAEAAEGEGDGLDEDGEEEDGVGREAEGVGGADSQGEDETEEEEEEEYSELMKKARARREAKRKRREQGRPAHRRGKEGRKAKGARIKEDELRALEDDARGSAELH